LNLIRVMPAKGQDMPTSIFLAKLIGPFALAVGVVLCFFGYLRSSTAPLGATP
jgi:hypothetical protein